MGELNRITNASKATLTKRSLEEQKRKDEIAEAKRKRKADREAKNAIRAKIAAAKEERMKKEGLLTVVDNSSKSQSNSTLKKEKPAKKVYTSCALAIRTPSGSTIKHDFKPDDTLQTVYDHLKTSCGITGDFAICTTFPRKSYRGADLNITLKAAD